MNQTVIAWLEVNGKKAKFYHFSPACISQLEPGLTVTGTEQEALRKGIMPCPDCEKQND